MRILQFRENFEGLRWTLPTIAFVAGAVAVLIGAMHWAKGPAVHPGAGAVALGGVGLLSGAFALWIRARGRIGRTSCAWRADISAALAVIIAATAAMLGMGVWGAHGLAADMKPAATVTGDLSSIELRRSGGRSRYKELRLRVTGRSEQYEWTCRLDCRPWGSMRAASLQAGQPARLAVIGKRIIGFEVHGRTFLHPAAERRRLLYYDFGLAAVGFFLPLAGAIRAVLYARDLRQGF